MKTMLAALAAAASLTTIGGCATTDYYDSPHGYYDRGYYSEYGRYDYDRPDPRYGGYYADRYYRNDSRYRPYRLNRNDRIYRGQDGRYYCRRADGTTGLIVGGIAGGVLGNIIAPGGSKTLGTIIGAVVGGAAGAAIDANNVTCR
ncbi:hypothetical protein GCM10011515_05420 [Tsuneonella deserti]|uniref:17 kDa surface antigen n=1 Tax=Tsuneonella deserti TaxID=2035528 RepID=A0ABQ1S0D7_9SPHN|nr:glycine zipper 2TM domain-containing protein [Tsuneonella deserti]GGD88667.1 hypothetical protein GCM10011515_05420 [Tsuneonella deserti]